VLLAALGALALLALPSAAAAKDRNNDRIPDRWEKRHHLSLEVKQTNRDQDRDHLRNRGEFLSGNDPRDRDSDDDGVMDDDENAGTIASFDAGTGRLVIDLFAGDSVSGIVNGDTRIRCDEDEDHHSEASASHEGEGNSGPSDNSGPGSENSGPDDDQAGEPEDHHGDQHGDDDHRGDQPGDEQEAEDHQGRDDDANCTTADLVAGAVVEEAELELANGVATYEEVELEGSDDS
jgi:hypothetical protein